MEQQNGWEEVPVTTSDDGWEEVSLTVADEKPSKKKVQSKPVIEPVNRFAKDILPSSGASVSAIPSTYAAGAFDLQPSGSPVYLEGGEKTEFGLEGKKSESQKLQEKKDALSLYKELENKAYEAEFSEGMIAGQESKPVKVSAKELYLEDLKRKNPQLAKEIEIEREQPAEKGETALAFGETEPSKEEIARSIQQPAKKQANEIGYEIKGLDLKEKALSYDYENQKSAIGEDVLKGIENDISEQQNLSQNIQDGKWVGDEQSLTKYNEITGRLQSAFETPEIKKFVETENKLNEINSDRATLLERYPDLKLYSEIAEQKSKEMDDAWREKGVVGKSVNRIFTNIGKSIDGLIEGVATLPRTLTPNDTKGWTDKLAEFAEDISAIKDLEQPTPTSLQHAGIEDVEIVDGYKVFYSDGKPTRVTDEQNLIVRDDELKKEILGKATGKTKTDISVGSLANSGLQVISDMAIQLLPVAGGVGRVSSALGAGKKTAAGIGLLTGVTTQVHNDAYKAAKEAGATNKEASAYALANAGMITTISALNPLESRVAQRMFAGGKKATAQQYVSAIAGGEKKSVVKNILSNTAKELLEEEGELFGEDLQKRLFNGVTQTDFETGVSANEIINTAVITAIATPAFGFADANQGNQLIKDALLQAVKNPQDLMVAVDGMIGKKIATSKGLQVMTPEIAEKLKTDINTISQRTNSIAQTGQLDDDKISVAAELIKSKLNLETQNSQEGIDDVVVAKNKQDISAINKQLEMLVGWKAGDSYIEVDGKVVDEAEFKKLLKDENFLAGLKQDKHEIKIENNPKISEELNSALTPETTPEVVETKKPIQNEKEEKEGVLSPAPSATEEVAGGKQSDAVVSETRETVDTPATPQAAAESLEATQKPLEETETAAVLKQEPVLIENDYDLDEKNINDALYDIEKGIGFKLGQSGYSRKGNTVIRVKNHTPEWGYFREDIERNGVKKIVNVTVGDFDNSDYMRNKTQMAEMQKEFPDVEFVDVKVEKGESINQAIKNITEKLNEEEKENTPQAETSNINNVNEGEAETGVSDKPVAADLTKDFSEGRKFAVDYVVSDQVELRPVKAKPKKGEKVKWAKRNINIDQRLDLRMSNEEKVRAVKQIKKGEYDKPAAKMLLDRLEQMHDSGYLDFVMGQGSNVIQAGAWKVEEVKQRLAEIKALKEEVYADYSPEMVAYFAENDAMVNDFIDAIENEEATEENHKQLTKTIQDENESRKESTTQEDVGTGVEEPTGESKTAEKILSEKEKAAKELDDKIADARKRLSEKLAKARNSGELGSMKNLFAGFPELVELAVLHAEKGVKKFIEFVRENFPELNSVTDQELEEEIFNKANKVDGKEEAPEGKEKRRLAQQFLKSKDISQKFKDAITEESIYYDRFPNTLSVQEANAFLETFGEAEAQTAVLDLGNGMRFAPRMILGQILIKKMNAKGYDAEAVEFAEKFFELSTELGQGIQALSLFQYLTPEGQVKAATKVVKKLRNKQIKVSYKEIKKLKKAVEKATEEAADETVKKVVKKIKKVAAITDIASPKYGEKNKIVTKAEYNKLLKELRGSMFSNVDPRIVKIAAFHIEAGSREFGQFAETMVRTLGKKVKPYLKDLYKQAQDLFEDKEGFTSEEDILKAENEEKGQEIKAKIEKALKSGNKKSLDEAIAEIMRNGELWGKYKDLAVKRLQRMNLAQIQGDIKQKAALDEFVQGLVKNIRGQAEKKGEGKSLEKKPAIQIIADAYKNFEKYEEVWEQTKAQFAEQNKDNPEKLAELDAYFGDITLKPFSENLVKQSVDEIIGNRIKEIVGLKEKGFDTSSFEDEIVEKLIFETGLAEEEIRDYIEAVKDELEARKNDAQEKIDKKKRIAEEKKKQIVEKAHKKKTKPLWKERRENAIKATIKNLENRLFEKSANKRTSVEEFASRLVSNIGNEVRNQIQTKAKKTLKDNVELLVEILKNKDIYNDVLTETQKQIIEKYKDNPTALLQFDDALFKILENPFYESIVSRIVKEGLKDLDIKIGEIIKKHYTVVEDAKKSLANKLIDEAGLSKQEALELAAEVEKEFDKLVVEKKKQYLDKALNQKQRKKPNVNQLYQKLLETANVGVLSDSQFNDLYAEKMGYATLTADQANKIKELAEKVQNAPDGHLKFRAIEDLLKYHAQLKGVSWYEIPMAWWYASILSGHQTQQRNLIANMANSIALYFNSSIQSRSPILMAKAMILGAKKGILEAQDVLQTGYSPIRGKIEIPPILERVKFEGWKYPLNAAKYVRRAMAATDVVFFEAQKEMRAYQLAQVQAAKEGKLDPTINQRNRSLEILNATDGAYEVAFEQAKLDMETKLAEIEASNLSEKEKEKERKAAKHAMARRAYDILSELRPTSIKDEAATFASKGTYNYKPYGLIGAMANSFNQLSDKAPFVRFVVPFVNIISNVANDALNYTPYGFLRYATTKKIGENEYEGGSVAGKLMGRDYNDPISERERADMVYKAAMGVAFTAAVLALSAPSGDDDEPLLEVTANGTGDWKKNMQLREAGWQPYSIRVKKPNGKYSGWVSYQYSPLILALGWVGNIRDFERYREEKIDDDFFTKYGRSFAFTVSSFFDMSFLASAEKMLSGVIDPRNDNKVDDAMQAAVKTAKTFVIPNLYTQSAKAIQDYFDIAQKETRGTMLGYALRDIPIARNQYNNQVNILGEDVPPDSDVLFSSSSEASKELLLLADKNVMIAPPNPLRDTYFDEKDGWKEKYMATDRERFYKYSKDRGGVIKDFITENYDYLQGIRRKDFKKIMTHVQSEATAYAKTNMYNAAQKPDFKQYMDGVKEKTPFEKLSEEQQLWEDAKSDAKVGMIFQKYKGVDYKDASKKLTELEEKGVISTQEYKEIDDLIYEYQNK